MRIGINIKFGIAAGIINCAAWYFIAKSLGYYSLDIYSYKYYITLLLLLVGVFTSIYFERKSKGGFIDFRHALKTGILYALILSLFLFIFNFVYHKYITPDAIDFFASE